MTDEERAERFITNWTMLQNRAAVLANGVLQADYEAVRLEERAAIVAWLRRRDDEASIYVASLAADADAIERGEHEAGTRS